MLFLPAAVEAEDNKAGGLQPITLPIVCQARKISTASFGNDSEQAGNSMLVEFSADPRIGGQLSGGEPP